MKISKRLGQCSAVLPVALVMISTLSCASESGKPSTPVAAIAPKWSLTADGFASINALDQNGTTGGAGGQTVTVDNLADLEKYALAAEPYIILVKGTIAKEPFGKEIKIASNKTFIGLGADATILHGELSLKNVSNIIVRNLTIRDSWIPDDPQGKLKDFDGLQIDNSHHIWIDHCLLTHMEDGLIDFRKESDYLTVSWCVLSNHNKAFGIGWSSSAGKRHVTLHHTWIHDTNQRNPSLDNGTGHLYNNWLQNISSYGNYSRGKSKVVVENSVFDHVQNPLLCDVEAELVSRGNLVNDSPGRNDAKGEAFNPRNFYEYSPDAADAVPDLLKNYAGPQQAIAALYASTARATTNPGN
jgi:pectate lyase